MDDVDRMLRQPWDALKREAGRDWYNIVRLFDETVTSLPEEPSSRDFEGMMEQISGPLNRYQSGQRLLSTILAFVNDELGAGGETPAQKGNRLRGLPKSEEETALSGGAEGGMQEEEEKKQLAEAEG